MDILTLDQDVPFNGLLFSCTPPQWSVSKVRNEIKQVLYTDMPLIKVAGTSYTPFPSDELYEQNHMVWDVGASTDAAPLRVGVQYDTGWPFGMRVRPSSGDTMQEQSGNGFVDYTSSFCLAFYHFTYDLSFPLLFSVTDPQSFNGQGLTFQFAEPVIIDHNEANRQTYGISDFMFPIYNDTFCSDATEQQYHIIAQDAKTGLDIPSANISFQCVDRLCQMGQTTFSGSDFQLIKGLPATCSGGLVMAKADGYLDGSTYVKVKEAPGTITVPLVPVFDLNYTVTRRTIDNPVLKKSFPADEEALISLSNGNSSQLQLVNYPNTQNMTLRLVGGDESYKVTVYLVQGNLTVGGYQGTLNYTYDEIAGAKSVSFNAIDFGKQFTFDNQSIFNQSIYRPQIVQYDNAGDRLP